MIKQKENVPTAGTDEGTAKDLLNNTINSAKEQEKLRIPVEPVASAHYIPPMKMAILMKTATKVMDIITNTPAFIASYEDIDFLLEVISFSVKRARGNC